MEDELCHQDDDDRLWDELNHQQSREIQEHRHKIAASTGRGGGAATATAIKAAISSAAAAVVSAGKQPLHQNNLMRSSLGMSHLSSSSSATSGTNSRTLGGDLSEFGLHSASIDNKPIPQSPMSQPMEIDNGRQQYINPSTAGYHQDTDSVSAPLLHNDYQQPETGHDDQVPGPSSKGKDFVFLRKFRMLSNTEGWGAVPNLDLFFTSIYNYYYHRGFVSLVGKGLVDLISLFFTLWLSVFLFAYLDWATLFKCQDEESCHPTLQNYIIEKPFSKMSTWRFLVLLYCILFICYGILSIATFVATVRDALEAKFFYEDKLGISASKLEGGAVEWDDIVKKIIQLQESGEYRVAIHGQDLDALIIAQRIMRKENFMVAFFNQNLLDLRIPLPWSFGVNGRSKEYFLSKSLEWSLYVCILSYMFNHKYQLRPAFYMDPSALKRRLVLCGIAQAVFMPFLLLFMMLYFFLLNLHEWQSSKQYLGPREWSNTAKWTFREFNELPHVFERRLGPSYQAAEDYLKLFTQSSAMASLGRVIMFMSGSLLAVLVAFAAANDSILLHVKLGQWNLLWYVGILGVIFSVGKGLLPDSEIHPPYIRNLFAEMDNALTRVATHTHYHPDIWKGRGWKNETKKAFSKMFQSKAQLFALELLSVVFAPFVLCVSLPKCAEDICAFVQKLKMDVPGVGDVCGFSCFDFNLFEDENWEGKKISSRREVGVGDSDNTIAPSGRRISGITMRLNSCPKTKHGKIEKSFFSFKAAHPGWKCDASGQNLIDRVESYRKKEALAFSKERQCYIEAAARQLETLLLIEQRGEEILSSDQDTGISRLDESYVNNKIKKRRMPDSVGSGSGDKVNKPGAMNTDDASKSVGSGYFLAGSDASTVVPQKSNHENLLESNFQNEPSQTSFASASALLSGSFLRQSGSTTHSSSTTPSPLEQNLNASLAANLVSAASVLHYADAGLSTELRRILNRSTLDPDVSVIGSTFNGANDSALASLIKQSLSLDQTNGNSLSSIADETTRNSDSQMQYMLLERYHSHLSEQQQLGDQERHGSINLNNSTGTARGTSESEASGNEKYQSAMSRNSIV